MILDPALLAAYLVLATALAVSPGPDVLFVLAKGMRHKTKGAVGSALGIGCGSAIHALAAALGISALVAASPLAFDLLRYAGATYLVYLAVEAFRAWWNAPDKPDRAIAGAAISPWNVFRRGLITNLLNPKVIVFYLALLPQFVNVGLGHVGLQIFLLGCIHNAIGLTFLIAIGLAAGKASNWLLRTKAARWLDAVAGLFFIGLALRLAVSGKPHH